MWSSLRKLWFHTKSKKTSIVTHKEEKMEIYLVLNYKLILQVIIHDMEVFSMKYRFSDLVQIILFPSFT